MDSLAGLAVHHSIANQIGSWSRTKKVSISQAEADAVSWLRLVWSDKEKRVIEILNGQKDLDEYYRYIEFTSRKRVNAFFKLIWPNFSYHTYVGHEVPGSFNIGDVRIRLRVDFVSRDQDEHITISDWKTGSSPDVDSERYQMIVYYVWARSYYPIDSESINVQTVNLKTGLITRFDISPEEVEDITNRVLSETHNLRPPVKKTNFPATPSLNNCISCPHLSQCDAGKTKVTE